jgi:hypothetical protein
MGYIPPSRDEQAFQYGKRLVNHYRAIKPISRVVKGKYIEIFTERQGPAIERTKSVNNKSISSSKYKKATNITGKGNVIDEVI